jgi:hypothetical protein
LEERLSARLAEASPTITAAVGQVEDAVEETDAPAGPSEAEEAVMLADRNTSTVSPDTVPAGVGLVAEVEETPAKLPSLDELVQRIPPDVRELMDELFRAKFVRVQRVPKKALQG